MTVSSSSLTVRPMPDERQAGDPAPMRLYCQRCGAHARLWTVTVDSVELDGTYFDARLCGICARGVLTSTEEHTPYLGPPTVTFRLLDWR